MASSSHPTTRITVLISGGGTNLQAIIDSVQSQELKNCEIVRVISNRKNAYGLTRATNANIPTLYHNLVAYKKKYPEAEIQKAREAYDQDLAALILKDAPHIIVCAGWMHILSTPFLTPLAAAGVHIINLHPALPGAYNGANAIERSHANLKEGKIEKAGVMIHYVIGEVDMGEPILVEEIPYRKEEGDEELEKWEEKVHGVEWKVIVKGTQMAVERFWKEKESSS